MDAIVQYFSGIPSSHRSAILAGGIAFFWLIESGVPLFRFHYEKWRHALINIFFTLTTVVVNFSLAFLLVLGINWTQNRGLGLMNMLSELPLWLNALFGLLILDFIGAFLVHWVEHKVKWMWMFHLIHHSDREVDTTTANRHHPGESVFRFAFTLLAVFVSGAPFWLVMLYQSMSVVFSQFNHANIQLPRRLDNLLSLVFVTPNMHHVHHHYILPYTDSNYGNIFSIWDRFWGTFRKLDPGSLTYGIDTHMQPKEQSDIWTLLKMPFGTYRAPVGAKFQETEAAEQQP